jgi:hypothetical protein
MSFNLESNHIRSNSDHVWVKTGQGSSTLVGFVPSIEDCFELWKEKYSSTLQELLIISAKGEKNIHIH